MDRGSDHRAEASLMLDGKTAWVTGSAQGIGRAVAQELCSMGARVAVHGIRDDAAGYYCEDEPRSMHDVVDEIAVICDGEAMAEQYVAWRSRWGHALATGAASTPR